MAPASQKAPSFQLSGPVPRFHGIKGSDLARITSVSGVRSTARQELVEAWNGTLKPSNIIQPSDRRCLENPALFHGTSGI